MSTSTSSTAHSEAEKRSVTLTTSNGDPIKYAGNPAELPGARHEMNRCLRRIGAFDLLIKHNASRMPNGTISVESLSTIPFVLGTANDPNLAAYTASRILAQHRTFGSTP